jgi:HAD superfamily hydrolase (TIGR01509 family)
VEYTTLLLDLDGVLRLWPPEHSALEIEHDLALGSVRAAAFEPALLEQVITGKITDQEWRNQVGAGLARTYPLSRANEAVVAWSRHAGTVHREALDLVIRARSQCRVGLVTNATDRLPRDLAELGLTKHLDFIVNSSEVGFSKPNPEIFRQALATAGAQLGEALFVDDTLPNVAAASTLGIRAHHFTTVAGLRAFLQSAGMATDAA